MVLAFPGASFVIMEKSSPPSRRDAWSTLHGQDQKQFAMTMLRSGAGVTAAFQLFRLGRVSGEERGKLSGELIVVRRWMNVDGDARRLGIRVVGGGRSRFK